MQSSLSSWFVRLTGLLTVGCVGSFGQPTHAEISEGEWAALDRAVDDLRETFGPRYLRGWEYAQRLRRLRAREAELIDSERRGSPEQGARRRELHEEFQALRTEALLANPLLDFDELLLVQRSLKQLGLPANFHANTEIPMTGYDNRLVVLSPVRPDGRLMPLYRPEGGRFIGDVDLHFAGDRLLCSMPGDNGRWQVFELNRDGSDARELPLILEPDVDNYDACYLPDGRVVFTSTAPFVGVPCVLGASHVANLYLWDPRGSIRQLTFDQDHSWCPTVDNSGRVIYLRWEYAGLPHANSRILFAMNPDGTQQRAIFSSSSFFPPSFFYGRPIPGTASKFVGIATGHHGVRRSGRMLVLDLAQGSREADGVVQEIPGWGRRVEPIIRDTLVDGVWPQFLHPYPLSEKYYLVSAKLGPDSDWGLYLADVFDNLLLLKQSPGYALFEPIPLRSVAPPPAVPDRVDPQRSDALVYVSDVYRGRGLLGIPRGTVKALRLVSFHYAYRGVGGLLGSVGMDGPWDVKQVLGTTPVEPDGSAFFRVPANTPIAVQPLDEEGQALQLMRSWFTAMPGETLSCVGCHEDLPEGSPRFTQQAALRSPSEIRPWYGPTRGFAFAREVQPVLDRYCLSCHDGQPAVDGSRTFSLRGDKRITDWSSEFAGSVSQEFGGQFSVAYAELHRFVRRPGIESDIHTLAPMEFHAGTTELVQLLRRGHYGVELDPESWDRLVTWIDLNAPYHGTWTEIFGRDRVEPMAARRREMSRRYAHLDTDPEAIPADRSPVAQPIAFAVPSKISAQPTSLPERPFKPTEPRYRHTESGPTASRRIVLGEGIELELVLIPAGEFLMGDPLGAADQRPASRVCIERPFWIGRTEVSNEQFAQFDPRHDSHFEPMHAYQFGVHGFPVDGPQQPVVRVSWEQAVGFCQWLSARTGQRFDLPTEAQWEYACRAGTRTPFWYGDLDTDFSGFANLGDQRLRDFCLETYVSVRPIPRPSPYDDWVPKDARFDDQGFLSVGVGSYEPNPWRLHDMHGNVWEWTRTMLRRYPYRDGDGRNDRDGVEPRVVRGGSWYDRPKRSGSAFRLGYAAYQRVFNVGFRVVMSYDPSTQDVARRTRTGSVE